LKWNFNGLSLFDSARRDSHRKDNSIQDGLKAVAWRRQEEVVTGNSISGVSSNAQGVESFI
jgi:hypothetical protein